MKKTLKRIFAVTLNYKTYNNLQKCLDALETSSIPSGFSFHIIVIDSEYDLQVHQNFVKKYKNVEFIAEKKNLGVGGGFNKGFRIALNQQADYVLMLTPDIVLEHQVVKKLLVSMESDQSIGMVAPKMLLTTTPPRIYFISGRIDPKVKSGGHLGYQEIDRGQYDNVNRTDFLNCATVLVRREVFEKAGFLDPEYFLYYEDVDWTLNVKRKGYKLVVVPEAIVWHEESSSVGKDSPRQDYYISRNLLWFIRKNYPFQEQIIAYVYIIKEVLILIKNYVLNKNRKKSYYKLLGMFDFVFGKKGYKKISFK